MWNIQINSRAQLFYPCCLIWNVSICYFSDDFLLFWVSVQHSSPLSSSFTSSFPRGQLSRKLVCFTKQCQVRFLSLPKASSNKEFKPLFWSQTPQLCDKELVQFQAIRFWKSACHVEKWAQCTSWICTHSGKKGVLLLWLQVCLLKWYFTFHKCFVALHILRGSSGPLSLHR